MKNGVIKQVSNKKITEEELNLINQYSKKTLTNEEVYTFSLVLCDNEIDRDFERFSIQALQTLSKMFVGKTGIMDHNPTSRNQTARIYKTWVEKIEGHITKAGETYHQLKAKAYIPYIDSLHDIIYEIDTGIKKEISVGVSINEIVCSVCGENRGKNRCGHRSGDMIEGKLVHRVLKSPMDAYEWSFVAVPAQKAAGVIKSYVNGKVDFEQAIETIKNLDKKEVENKRSELKEICSYISEQLKSETEKEIRALIQAENKKIIEQYERKW